MTTGAPRTQIQPTWNTVLRHCPKRSIVEVLMRWCRISTEPWRVYSAVSHPSPLTSIFIGSWRESTQIPHHLQIDHSSTTKPIILRLKSCIFNSGWKWGAGFFYSAFLFFCFCSPPPHLSFQLVNTLKLNVFIYIKGRQKCCFLTTIFRSKRI